MAPGPTPDGTFGLAWRTLPGLVTGFYASLGNPNHKTIPYRSTFDSISYSLGFNFATDVLGHETTHVVGSSPNPGDYPQRDNVIMLQMIQLAADPEVQKATVFGSAGADPAWLATSQRRMVISSSISSNMRTSPTRSTT
jgi:hypothetical protein